MKKEQEKLVKEKATELANSKVLKHFTTSYISKKVFMEPTFVEGVLEEMVKEGKIERHFQSLCQNPYCYRVVAEASKKDDLSAEYSCNVCGHEEEYETIDDLYIRPIYLTNK